MGFGLGLAGAISGAGNAMTQGLQTMNAGIVQAGVHEGFAEKDRAFQMDKLKLQQQFESELTDRKIAADKENSLAQIQARGIEERKTATHAGGIAEDQAATQHEYRLDEQKQQQAASMSQKVLELGVTAQLSGQKLALEGKQLEAQKEHWKKEDNAKLGELKPVVTKDGYIALYNPYNGKSAGVVSDPDGKPIQPMADLPKSTIEQIVALRMQMAEEAKIFATRPKQFETPEQTQALVRDYRATQDQYMQQINELATTGKVTTKAAPAAKSSFNMGPWRNVSPPGKPSPVPPMLRRPEDQLGVAGSIFQKQ